MAEGVESFEAVFNRAVVSGRLVIDTPDNDAGFRRALGVEFKGKAGRADEFLFGFFGVAPGAVGEEMFGYGRGSGDHKNEGLIIFFAKEILEDGLDFGIEEGDVEDEIVTSGGEGLDSEEKHDGAEFIGHFA